MDVLEGPGPAGTRPYDELLCAPSTSKSADDVTFTRATASYTNLDERFRVAKRTYERQYAQLYFSRLSLLKGVMQRRVEQMWPGLPVCSILDVQETKEVAVIGTLYKNMKLKPSILDEYTKDRGLKAALGGAEHFCSDDDSVVLEDEGARMALRLAPGGSAASGSGAEGAQPLDVASLLTGMVLAVRGVHEPGGDFLVNSVCFAGMAPHPKPHPHPLPAHEPAAPPPPGPGDKYVALVSGLQMGSSKVDMLQTQLAVDFLTGNLGSPQEQALAAKVVRLVVAGGGVGQLDSLANAAAGLGAFTARPAAASMTAALQPVRDLDLLLSELASALPVDVMPGAEDPANVALPQQPMHRCLFPAVAGVGSGCLVRATNPHALEVDGVVMLGTSGQNLDDMAKYCTVRDRLDLMERSLRGRHMAPTAPDTLTCYPYSDDDPFILPSTPHVYFVGNQPEFATRLVRDADPVHGNGGAGSSGEGGVGVAVRLVAVPCFARTGTLVLLNLRTLQCHPVRFDGSLGV